MDGHKSIPRDPGDCKLSANNPTREFQTAIGRAKPVGRNTNEVVYYICS